MRGRFIFVALLAAVALSAGAKLVHVVDLDRGDDMQAPVGEALQAETLAVIIARGRCVRET